MFDMEKPLYTLSERKLPPYRDYLRLYWNVNRRFIIVVFLLVAVGLAYSIFLITQAFDPFNVLIFSLVGVAFALALVLVFVVPLVNRAATAKNLSTLDIRFYKDRLAALPSGQQENGRGVVIYYNEFGKRFETRDSIVCIRGKGGLVLSKEDHLPEEVVSLLLNKNTETK